MKLAELLARAAPLPWAEVRLSTNIVAVQAQHVGKNERIPQREVCIPVEQSDAKLIVFAVNRLVPTEELLRRAADHLQELAESGYNDPVAMEIYKMLEVE